MRGRIASAAVSVLGHGALAALLLVGLPWPERSGAVDDGLQGIEVLLAAGGAPDVQEGPPPEPDKSEPEKIVEKPVEPPPPPPPPPPEPKKVPEVITSTSEEADLDAAPKPKPRPKPVVETPRRPPPPKPVQPTAEPVPAPPAPPAETKVAALPASPGQSGSQSSSGAGSGAAATSGGNPGAEADYYATLLAWLERHKEYPRRAQMRRQEGIAHLRFTIDGEGHVLAFRLERSSGHESLDDAVERMIRKAGPLPPIPVALGKERLDLVVPVQFFLK